MYDLVPGLDLEKDELMLLSGEERLVLFQNVKSASLSLSSISE